MKLCKFRNWQHVKFSPPVDATPIVAKKIELHFTRLQKSRKCILFTLLIGSCSHLPTLQRRKGLQQKLSLHYSLKLEGIFGAVCCCNHSWMAPWMCSKQSCSLLNVMYYLLIKQKYITNMIWILLIPMQDWYLKT